MSTTALYIAAGTLLGVLQMGLGFAVGLWIRRAGRAADCRQLDEQRAREMLVELSTLTAGLHQDVQGHQAKISQINHRLSASRKAAETSLTELVVGVVAEVLRANGQLQQRLVTAETQLHHQSMEIASHLNQAHTDDLTGLPNRRAFDDLLRRRLEGYARYKVPFSLILIDIDFFKHVNDTHGHLAGDRLLCTIADVLRSALRKPDFIARYGGEEFAALLPYTSLQDAVHAANHARLAVQGATTFFEGATIQVTASVGLTAVQVGDNATTIIQRTDDALYASKTGGRNCGHMHDGAQCQRIAGSPATSGEAARTADDAGQANGDSSPWHDSPLSPELSAACAELRDSAGARDQLARRISEDSTRLHQDPVAP